MVVDEEGVLSGIDSSDPIVTVTVIGIKLGSDIEDKGEGSL